MTKENGMHFIVEIRENGMQLDEFATREQAEAYVKEQELADAKDGCYEDGYYAIRNVVTDECEIQWN